MPCSSIDQLTFPYLALFLIVAESEELEGDMIDSVVGILSQGIEKMSAGESIQLAACLAISSPLLTCIPLSCLSFP